MEFIKNIWHPFTQEAVAPEKKFITKAKGVFVYDNNSKYIDAISSWWTSIHGHCNKIIAKAIFEQAKKLDHIIFTDFVHQPALDLIEKLKMNLDFSFAKFFFSDNGSTSVEVALKIAHQYWKNLGKKRTKIISFEGGYHGDTFGAMSLGVRSKFFKAFEDLFFKVISIPVPYTWLNDNEVYAKEEYSIKILEDLLRDNGESVSCIIIEPIVQGASGMRIFSKEFLDKVVLLCRKYEIIVIFDEVMTGFGRTGKMFAYNHISSVPDIVCLSKAITGGFFPLGITACNLKIYQAFYDDTDFSKTFLHGHSYTANPIICAAASASIGLIDIARVNTINHWYSQLLVELQNLTDVVEKIRTIGIIFAFDVKESFYKRKFSCADSFARSFKERLLQRKIIIRPLGNTIYILLPYCITNSQTRYIFKQIKKCLLEIC
jgi:adenosylmethionine-8-amino-7-oxononanoate aminotransferase